MYLLINKWVIAVKVSNFSGQYLRDHWTLDIGVLGYIGIVWPKEHSPEVWSVPPVTPCLYVVRQLRVNVFLINTEMCMSWLLLTLIVSMHGSTMKRNTNTPCGQNANWLRGLGVIEKKSWKVKNLARWSGHYIFEGGEGGKFYWSEFFRWSLLVLVVNMGCRQGRALGIEEAGSWSCCTHCTAAHQGKNFNRQERLCT